MSFKKEKYYHVHLVLDGTEAVSDRFSSKEAAEKIATSCKGNLMGGPLAEAGAVGALERGGLVRHEDLLVFGGARTHIFFSQALKDSCMFRYSL